MATYLFEDLAERLTTTLDMYQRIQWDWDHPMTRGEWWWIIGAYDYLHHGEVSIQWMDLLSQLGASVKSTKDVHQYNIQSGENSRTEFDVYSHHDGHVGHFHIMSKRMLDLMEHNTLARRTKPGAEIQMNLCLQCSSVIVSTRSQPKLYCNAYCKNSGSVLGMWRKIKSIKSKVITGGGQSTVGRFQQLAFSRRLAGYLASIALKDFLKSMGSEKYPDIHDVPQLDSESGHMIESKDGIHPMSLWGTFDVIEMDPDISLHWHGGEDVAENPDDAKVYVKLLNKMAEDDPEEYFGSEGDLLRRNLQNAEPGHPLTKMVQVESLRRSHYFTNRKKFKDKACVQYNFDGDPTDKAFKGVEEVNIHSRGKSDTETESITLDMDKIRAEGQAISDQLRADGKRWEEDEHAFKIPVHEGYLDEHAIDLIKRRGMTPAQVQEFVGRGAKFSTVTVPHYRMRSKTLDPQKYLLNAEIKGTSKVEAKLEVTDSTGRPKEFTEEQWKRLLKYMEHFRIPEPTRKIGEDRLTELDQEVLAHVRRLQGFKAIQEEKEQQKKQDKDST